MVTKIYIYEIRCVETIIQSHKKKRGGSGKEENLVYHMHISASAYLCEKEKEGKLGEALIVPPTSLICSPDILWSEISKQTTMFYQQVALTEFNLLMDPNN